jgi:hypothetical protein
MQYSHAGQMCEILDSFQLFDEDDLAALRPQFEFHKGKVT